MGQTSVPFASEYRVSSDLTNPGIEVIRKMVEFYKGNSDFLFSNPSEFRP